MSRAEDKNAYVYRHRTKDTNEVFYVGIGIVRRRAWSKYGRNKHWLNVVNKHGFEYEIIQDGITREMAKELEIFLIELYGRRDKGNGTLVNMTGGGDGMFCLSDESRRLMSDKRKGTKRSDDTKRKMSQAQSRGNHSHAKKVIDNKTNIIYNCIKDAAEGYGIGYHNLKDKLSGRKGSINNTSLTYYNGDTKHYNI